MTRGRRSLGPTYAVYVVYAVYAVYSSIRCSVDGVTAALGGAGRQSLSPLGRG